MKFITVDRGIQYLNQLIDNKLSAGQKGAILCAGGSASGKTNRVAEKVHEAFAGRSAIVSLDNYYKGLAFMQAEWARGNQINYDQPEALDLALARLHIAQLLSGLRVPKFVYDFKTGLRSQDGWIEPCDLLIIEGLFALTDLFMDIPECWAKIFVDIGTHGRFVRRLLRDIERTSWSPSDIIGYFARITEPMHQQYIESSKINADLIIENEYHAENECKTGFICQHLKFRRALDEDTLRRMGAERLGSFSQSDIYLNPKGRSLIENDEMIRIRSEGSRYVFSYIGPREQVGFKKRRKVGPFEVSADTVSNFKHLYSEVFRELQKVRTLYLLPEGILVAVDHDVLNLKGGHAISHGSFTELRFTGNIADDTIRSVVSSLGLDISAAITDSYAELLA